MQFETYPYPIKRLKKDFGKFSMKERGPFPVADAMHPHAFAGTVGYHFLIKNFKTLLITYYSAIMQSFEILTFGPNH